MKFFLISNENKLKPQFLIPPTSSPTQMVSLQMQMIWRLSLKLRMENGQMLINSIENHNQFQILPN
jgi:hypothetical protein